MQSDPFWSQHPQSSPEQICLAVGGNWARALVWRGQERFALDFLLYAPAIKAAGLVFSEDGLFRGRREMSTFVPSGKNIDRKWFVVDASGKTLGRLATKAADVLSGKLNPQYVPYIDVGDHVIVINAEKVRLTGLKAQNKLYRRYTGFPGGLREESFMRLLNRKPEMILEQAIKGMLPKSKMGRQMATKLKVYRGDKHPHEAQQPVNLEIA
jgi:large subunit ribosomal protein L13